MGDETAASSSMQFCPVDGTMLLVEVDGSERLRWLCQTCPYVNYPSHARRIAMPLKTKQVDDVLGGDEAWANVDQTDLRCEDCGHERAYYIQMQTRSADEPMTVFYKVRVPGVLQRACSRVLWRWLLAFTDPCHYRRHCRRRRRRRRHCRRRCRRRCRRLLFPRYACAVRWMWQAF